MPYHHPFFLIFGRECFRWNFLKKKTGGKSWAGPPTLVLTFMALEAPFLWKEHVLQFPGHYALDGNPMPEGAFVAEENLNSVCEGAVRASNTTVKTRIRKGKWLANAPHPDVLCCSVLTFDPSPLLEEEQEYSLLAPDNTAEHEMVLPPRPRCFHKAPTPTACSQWQDPKEACKHPPITVCSLPF